MGQPGTYQEIKFQSSGQTESELQERNRADFRRKRNIGIKTPMELGGDEGLFKMHSELDRQISDNLRNLLLTNHGERLGRYNFGANLRPLVFRYGEDDFETEVSRRIQETVGREIPYVSLATVEIAQGQLDEPGISSIVV